MELSRQMLLLTAENYGSYYLHITKPEAIIYAKVKSTCTHIPHTHLCFNRRMEGRQRCIHLKLQLLE